MKGVLPWLVRLGSSCQYTRFLSCSGQTSTKYSFPRCTLFQILCPHRPATWAGSRAGPPISECVSPIARTNDGRVNVIKAAHRTSDFKVIFMYTRYLIQHWTYRVTVPLLLIPPSIPPSNSSDTHTEPNNDNLCPCSLPFVRGCLLFGGGGGGTWPLGLSKHTRVQNTHSVHRAAPGVIIDDKSAKCPPFFSLHSPFFTSLFIYLSFFAPPSYITKVVYYLVMGFGRATRPCAARTYLFRLNNTQNEALNAPPPPPHSHSPFFLTLSVHYEKTWALQPLVKLQ